MMNFFRYNQRRIILSVLLFGLLCALLFLPLAKISRSSPGLNLYVNGEQVKSGAQKVSFGIKKVAESNAKTPYKVHTVLILPFKNYTPPQTDARQTLDGILDEAQVTKEHRDAILQQKYFQDNTWLVIKNGVGIKPVNNNTTYDSTVYVTVLKYSTITGKWVVVYNGVDFDAGWRAIMPVEVSEYVEQGVNL